MNYIKRTEILENNELTLASFSSRIFSFIIDVLLIILLIVFLVIIFQLLGFNVKQVHISGLTHIEYESENLGSTAKFIIKCLLVSIPTLYFTLTTYLLNGRTFGKMICRIQVLSLYHPKIAFLHCLERSLGYVASTLEAGLGFIQALWNHNRMTLHDKIAETIVVRKMSKKKLFRKMSGIRKIRRIRPTNLVFRRLNKDWRFKAGSFVKIAMQVVLRYIFYKKMYLLQMILYYLK